MQPSRLTIDVCQPCGHFREHGFKPFRWSLTVHYVLLESLGKVLFGLRIPLSVFRSGPFFCRVNVGVRDSGSLILGYGAVEQPTPSDMGQFVNASGHV